MNMTLVVLVILVLFHAAFGKSVNNDQMYHIEFIDCGSEQIYIEQIVIQGCPDFPCRLRRGLNHTIIITPDYIDPNIDRLDIDVKTFVRGAMFPIQADFVKPCGLPCPLSERAIAPHISITAEISTTLLRGPAHLIIHASFMYGTKTTSHFCVEIPIGII